jgi:hypothetical protein
MNSQRDININNALSSNSDPQSNQAKASKLDKGNQVSLVVDDINLLHIYKEKCDLLEFRNSDLVKEIALLDDRIRSDSKIFEASISSFKAEIEKCNTIIESLNEKIFKLEDLIRFKDKSSSEMELTPTRYPTVKLDKYSVRTNLKNNASTVNVLSPKRVPCKPSRIDDMILYADSHGRGLSHLLGLKSSFKVHGMVKPNAKSSDIFKNVNTNCKALVLFAGSNDVYSNNSKDYLKCLRDFLAQYNYVEIILCTIPWRHDLPVWSVVNKEISMVNNKIKNLAKFFKRVHIVDVSNIGRKFYTEHGLHLNYRGKILVCESILECFRNCQSGEYAAHFPPLMLEWKLLLQTNCCSLDNPL